MAPTLAGNPSAPGTPGAFSGSITTSTTAKELLAKLPMRSAEVAEANVQCTTKVAHIHNRTTLVPYLVRANHRG
eukprot:7138202-Pyramimonas_sp.AAC.1